MSWLYSQALVAEYSEDTSLDGALCALWNGTPTQRPSWLPAKTTDACRLSRSGMTCKPLTAQHGEAVLMSFLAAFPARTSAQPERAQESTASAAACGHTWPESLAKFDPATRSWRTRQCLLFEDSTECLEIWPRWGMMRAGECWAQSMPEPHINGTESGLWPTPCLPGNGGSHGKRKLKEMLWPTPTAHNAKECNAPSEAERNTPTLAAQAGGKLNPTWVEWLMGWPLGWTDCAASATDKFQAWRHSHGAF
jgi:hypothetical protein